MTRLVLREVARWVRAVGAPLAVLTVVALTPGVVPDAAGGFPPLLPGRALWAAWVAAGAPALAWLLVAIRRTALQPARDRRAAQRLQGLRQGAAHHDGHLLCVERPLWQSRAGQRVLASDVQVGKVLEIWLSEAALPSGAFALVAMDREPATLVDWIPPSEVAAARRAEHVEAARRRARAAQATQQAARHDCKATADVVRAAEALLRDVS